MMPPTKRPDIEAAISAWSSRDERLEQAIDALHLAREEMNGHVISAFTAYERFFAESQAPIEPLITTLSRIGVAFRDEVSAIVAEALSGLEEARQTLARAAAERSTTVATTTHVPGNVRLFRPGYSTETSEPA